MAKFDGQWVLHKVGVADFSEDASGKYMFDSLEVTEASRAWEPELCAAMSLPIPVASVGGAAEDNEIADPAPSPAGAAATPTA